MYTFGNTYKLIMPSNPKCSQMDLDQGNTQGSSRERYYFSGKSLVRYGSVYLACSKTDLEAQESP